MPRADLSIVALSEVGAATGPEDEDEDVFLDLWALPAVLAILLFSSQSKIYQFDKEGNQWKVRGTGNVNPTGRP